MPEPITTGVVVAKTISAARTGANQDATSLLKRLLGPSVDEFAEALRRSVAYRTRNFGRIAERADSKRGNNGRHGVVSERLAYVMLEEGSLCDDELMAEYLGGILAGSKSPDGRDDRAVTWCRVISGMSWLQVRMHFLLYREWAARLHGIQGLKLGLGRDRARVTMDIDLDEFLPVLLGDSGIDKDEALQDSIFGLVSNYLIENEYAAGVRSEDDLPEPAFNNFLRTQPSVRGFELYAWAQGLPGLSVAEFPAKTLVFDTDPVIPRLTKVSIPRLLEQQPEAEAS